MITCFLCGGPVDDWMLDETPGYYLACLSCGVRSPMMPSSESAEQWWQERQDMIDINVVQLRGKLNEIRVILDRP